MAAQPRPGDSSGSMDGLIFIVACIGTIALMVWMIWSMNKVAIIKGLFFLVGWISKAAQHAPFLYPSEWAQNFTAWSHQLFHTDPTRYGWPAAKMMIGVITHTMALVFVPMVILRIWTIRKAHIVNRFVRRFNLDMLVKLNAKHYAAVASVAHENLLAMPLHEGPWAMPRSPIDWALEHELIYAEKKSTGGATLKKLLGLSATEGKNTKRAYIKGWNEKKMTWSVPERRKVLPEPRLCRLDIQKTDAALVKQLGDRWSGHDDLTIFEQCVLAILLVAICKGLPDARKLALRLANSFRRCDKKGRHKPMIDGKGIAAINARYIRNPKVKEIIKRHAFKTTVFMALLEATWDRGVFISAEFLWLRPVHPILFNSLNQMGGDRPFTQGTAAWAHYMVEKECGYAVNVPCIEGGTESIRSMLFDEEWIGSDEGLASDIEERRSKEGALSTDDASPTARAEA
ncbi:secretion/conjugation apparatus DotM-related subunit [Marinobacter sp. MBR-105]